MAAAEHKKSFSFTPDDAITTPSDFTNVLFAYANEHDLNLVITKEGLEPEFEIDGIPYLAMRTYRRMGPVPVMIVRCAAKYPDALEPDVPQPRKLLFRLLHNWWMLLMLLMFFLLCALLAEPGQRLMVLLAGVFLTIGIGVMYAVYYRNYQD